MAGLNPYTPGAGTKPRLLAGRAAQVALVRSLADQVAAGREANPMIYTGLRGVGKTSLLYESRDALRERGWLAGYYEVRREVEPGAAIRSIIQDSAELSTGRLRRALASGAHSIGGMKLHLGPAGFSFEVDTTAGATTSDDPYPELVSFLRRVSHDAKANGAGVALLIDELQVFRTRDLAVLVQALSALKAEPIALIGAGLPYLASQMSKANTYAERFRYEQIDRLSDSDARLAIAEPALDQGTVWQEDALARLLDLADGYPYFLQLYASEAWVVAGDAAAITRTHVDAAVDPVRRQLDAGLFAARYDRLSERERDYVDAMVTVMDAAATPSNRVGSGPVADVLGATQGALGPVRDRIIRKGIIHSPTYGVLEFSVPGFSDYVRRRSRAVGL